jgi:hypothetical protein
MTDWMPYSQAGSLSTLQCVTTWRGTEAGTGPLGAFWAGTDGTLWRSSTDPHSEFVQMFTDADTVVTHIAVDDRETIYGINSAGKPVQYGDDGWTSLDLGDHSEQYVMIDVAVALDDTVWFVAREGQYYVHGATTTWDGSREFGLKAVAPMKAPDPSAVGSVGQAWGVINWGGGQLAYSAGDGNGWVFKSGDSEWISDVVDVSTSVGYAWFLKTDGSVWSTLSGYTGERVGNLTAKSICGGLGDYCFAVGADGKPYRTTDPTPLA